MARRTRGAAAGTPPVARRTWIDRNAGWLVPGGVLAVTVLTFLPALHGQFLTWDDDRNFLMNTSYRGLGWTELRWMFTTFHLGPYQPLSWLTLGIDYVIWGMDPVGYHLTNVLIHTANAWLVYVLARQLYVGGPKPGPPFVLTSARAWPRARPRCCSRFIRSGWSRSRGSPSGATCSRAASRCSR